MEDEYLTLSEYQELSTKAGIDGLDDNIAPYWIKRAQSDIDTLTFNRIKKIGFNNLTELQKDIIKRAIFSHTNFLYSNNDILESVLSSYSINGVSMAFNSSNPNLKIIDGTAIKASDYNLLNQTGLTCLSFNY